MQTDVAPDPGRPQSTVDPLGDSLVLVLLGGLVVGLVVGGGATEVTIDEISGAGPIVGWGLPIVRLLATTAGVLAVGLLGYAAVLLGPQGRKGVLSQIGRPMSCVRDG